MTHMKPATTMPNAAIAEVKCGVSRGSIALVGDLQRLSRSQSLQRLLGAITRRYAAELALRQAASAFPGAQVSLAS